MWFSLIVTGKPPHCSFLDRQILFSLPVLLKTESESSLVGTWQPAKVNPSHLFCKQKYSSMSSSETFNSGDVLEFRNLGILKILSGFNL